ncbi:PAS domain S-box protein [bacterium]|nr:PAS domain S-box protein [bacterium]
MDDRPISENRKTIAQLLGEIDALRARLSEVEQAEIRFKQNEQVLRRQSQRTELINSLIVLLNGCQSERDMYAPLVDTALSLSSLETGCLLMVQSGRLELLHNKGMTDEIIGYLMGGHLALSCLERFEGRSRALPVRELDEALGEAFEHGEFHQAFAVPVQSGDTVLGVLIIATRRDEDADRHAMVALSSSLRMAGDIMQRRRAELELAQSETRNTAIFAASPDIMFCTDRDGMYLDFRCSPGNPYYGPPEYVVGHNLRELLPEHLHDLLLTAINKSLDTQELVTIEYDMETRQQGPRTFEARVVPLEDNQVLSIVRDVTERRRAQMIQRMTYEITEAVNRVENLRELYSSIRECLGTVIDTENFHICLYDPITDIFEVPYDTDKYDQQVRFTAQELGRGLSAYVFRTGKPLLVNEEDLEELNRQGEVELVGTPCEQWLGAPLITDRGTIGVVVVQNYDKGLCYTQGDVEIMSFISGQIANAIERKRIQIERRRLAAAVDQAGEAILITSTEGIIEYVNPAFERVTGYTENEIVGQTLAIVKSGKHPEEFWVDMWNTIKGGEVWKGHIMNRRKDGTIYEEVTTIAPVRDAYGHIDSFVEVRRLIRENVPEDE